MEIEDTALPKDIVDFQEKKVLRDQKEIQDHEVQWCLDSMVGVGSLEMMENKALTDRGEQMVDEVYLEQP